MILATAVYIAPCFFCFALDYVPTIMDGLRFWFMRHLIKLHKLGCASLMP